MVAVGGFLIGIILFAQVANPVHKIFDPLQVKNLISVKQLFSAKTLEGVPAKVPDLIITTIEGKRFTLKELTSRNRLVVVNFWASWCSPCVEEMPYFEKIHRDYQNKGVVFLGIAIKDSLSAVGKFIVQKEITYKVAMDDQDKIANAFGGVKVLPTTIFIDKQNSVVKIHKGYLSQRELDKNLKYLLQ
ncbi:MAG TPA: TlpA disulfide reductase family protein [Candidatus Bathyarchaeia archaeon]|nr:TlpA disulfide reductase family protein [Candidatus Bathyarchaeia archaeon]